MCGIFKWKRKWQTAHIMHAANVNAASVHATAPPQSCATSAANGAPGMDPLHARIVDFAARQWLDMVSPSNAPWLNPEVLARTAATGGMNFVAGAGCWMDDLKALAFGRDTPDALKRAAANAEHPDPTMEDAFIHLVESADREMEVAA